MAAGCVLCDTPGGRVLLQRGRWRVLLADEPLWPGFTRVVWQDHVREMTDLDGASRARLMDVVWAVESVQRRVFAPDKVNVASLGNVVAHLHWHVIPRWVDDAGFPAPVWAVASEAGLPGDRRAALQARRDAVAQRLPAYEEALRQALGKGTLA